MSDARQLPERRAVKQALRTAGLSSRQTDALLRDGWRALVGESQSEVDELRERMESIIAALECRPDPS